MWRITEHQAEKKLTKKGIDALTQTHLKKTFWLWNHQLSHNQPRSLEKSLVDSISVQCRLTPSIHPGTYTIARMPTIDQFPNTASFDDYMLDEVSPSSYTSNGKSTSHLLVPAAYSWADKKLCCWPSFSYRLCRVRSQLPGVSSRRFNAYYLGKFITNSAHRENQTNRKVADDKLGWLDCKNAAPIAEPSSVNSFVKALLHGDCMIQLDLPGILDIFASLLIFNGNVLLIQTC